MRGEAQAWAGRAKYYLVENRGLNERRIITAIGGYREHWGMELWLIRGGAIAPLATPTIEFKDVRFKKGRIRKSQYRHCGDA